ncbi:hypothetical protein ACFQ4C_27730 [Larkinella insperata]|uniref:O-antigen/teichoic acid export membrane protein n=1 Tax=Larkinella insperata TaxID=332158 RepID=A0ABW3QK79_9BACT|nr:hypothetical protein [Larkinella insperata]
MQMVTATFKNESTKYVLKENIIYLLSKVFSGILSLLALSLISYYYSDVEYGSFSLIVANANILTITFFYCIKLYYVRFNKNKIFHIQFKEIDSLVNLISIILLSISLIFIKIDISYIISAILAILQIKFELYQEKQRAEFKALKYLILNISKSTLYILLIWAIRSLNIAGNFQLVFTYITPLLALYTINFNKFSFNIKFDFEKIKRIYLYGYVFVFTPVSNALLYNYYRNLINIKLGAENLGGFAYVSDICENTVLAAMMAINLSGYPRLIKHYEEKNDEQFEKQSKLNLSFQLVIILTILIVYNTLMPFIGGKIFYNSYLTYINNLFLLILAGSFMKGLKYYYIDQYLLIFTNKSINVIATTLYLLISYFTLPILIDKYKIYGATYSFILSNTIYFLSAFILFKIKYNRWLLNYKYFLLCLCIITNMLYFGNSLLLYIFTLIVLILITKK